MAESAVCKYKDVAGQLLRRIESGELTGALPGVKQLAVEYEINFMTADKAIRFLEQQQVVSRIPRKGTYVRKQKNIALCVHDPNPFFTEIAFYTPFMGAIQKYLGERNYFMISENLYGKSPLYLENLARKVDGIVMFSKILYDMPQSLHNTLKVLAMGVVNPDFPYDHISYDTKKVSKIAAEYLHGRGCKNPAYIGNDASILFKERCDSFMHHAGKLGMKPLKMNAPSGSSRSKLLEQLECFISLKDRPDGIFCPTDPEAVFVSNWLWGKGIVQGKDISIIGCNNETFTLEQSLAEPPATVDLRLYDIGHATVEMLCKRIDGYDGERNIRIFEPKLVTYS